MGSDETVVGDAGSDRSESVEIEATEGAEVTPSRSVPDEAEPDEAEPDDGEPDEAEPDDGEPDEAEVEPEIEAEVEPAGWDVADEDLDAQPDAGPDDEVALQRLDELPVPEPEDGVPEELEPEFLALLEEVEQRQVDHQQQVDEPPTESPAGSAAAGLEPTPEAAVPSAAVPSAAVPSAAVPSAAVPSAAGPGDGGPGDAAPAESAPAESAPAVSPAPLPGSAWGRLLRAMRPRASRAQLVAFVLCGVLGFTLFVSVHQTQEQGLRALRQSDLVTLLDNVTEKSTRLDDEARQLQQQADQLRSGSDRSVAAQQAARQRLDELGILAGTAPAVGPGIELTITDPQHQVNAATLLDTVQELRDAGAEAIQIDNARVVANTAFVDDTAGVVIDDATQTAPYHVLVIGDPQTLSAALDIPGGVIDVLTQIGASGKVKPRTSLTISALRHLATPQYARPAQS